MRKTALKNGDKVTTSIKILKVFETPQEATNDEEAGRNAFLEKEQAVVKDYVSKKNINAHPVGKGTYAEIIEPGTGADVDLGKYVTVKYRGQTFAGKVFDTNMDTTFGHTD
ncbi:MAG: hypothetical protein ABR503_11535, partial [Chitinophagaceae bacterium]